MTPEQQRIAIAEKCGWTQGGCGTGRGAFYYARHDKPNEHVFPVDYLTSLDAMHEAEKVLTADQWAQYYSCLYRVVYNTADQSDVVNNWRIIHATAAQRAEAFCRTLWPEKFK